MHIRCGVAFALAEWSSPRNLNVGNLPPGEAYVPVIEKAVAQVPTNPYVGSYYLWGNPSLREAVSEDDQGRYAFRTHSGSTIPGMISGNRVSVVGWPVHGHCWAGQQLYLLA